MSEENFIYEGYEITCDIDCDELEHMLEMMEEFLEEALRKYEYVQQFVDRMPDTIRELLEEVEGDLYSLDAEIENAYIFVDATLEKLKEQDAQERTTSD